MNEIANLILRFSQEFKIIHTYFLKSNYRLLKSKAHESQ